MDLSSKKDWAWVDLTNYLIYMSLADPINFSIDYVELKVDGIGCASTETSCDDIDDDCDGTINEGVKTTYYRDVDGDGKGDEDNSTLACSFEDVDGYVINVNDCNDADADIYIGNPEVDDDKDNDCDGLVDEGVDTQLVTCDGSIVTNASANDIGAGKYLQTWDGIIWEPEKSWAHNTLPDECTWACNPSYSFVLATNSCEADVQTGSCSGSLVANSIWNDLGQQGNYSYTGTNPSLSAHYSATPGECAWNCGSDYHYDTGVCLENSATSQCDLTDINNTLPVNAKWNNTNTFTQTWSESGWLPTSKKAVYNEIPGECNYSCETISKSCSPSPETYCGVGVQECQEGNWGGCVPTQANICSQNQYCSSNTCSFCTVGKKNCDLNLLNGCEVNVSTDINNCGDCGTVCISGQSCSNGICVLGGGGPTDPCEGVSCGSNSSCEIGNCVCESGFNNCNGSDSDGCEVVGSCNAQPDDDCEFDVDCDSDEYCSSGNCLEKECEGDFDCEGNCVDYKCEDVIQKSCFVPEQCNTDETCVDGYCQELSCGGGYEIKNRSCFCEGSVCNSVCYDGGGVCCNGKWKEGQSKCTSSISTSEITAIENVVNSSNDSKARDLFDLGQVSLGNGDEEKASAQFAVAELKARIALAGNPKDLMDEYDYAKSSLDLGDYAEAEMLARETIDRIPQGNPFGVIVTLLVIVVIVALFAFFIYKKKRMGPVDDENLF